MINNNNNNDLAIRFVNTAMSTVSSYVICHVIASPSNYPPRLSCRISQLTFFAAQEYVIRPDYFRGVNKKKCGLGIGRSG